MSMATLRGRCVARTIYSPARDPRAHRFCSATPSGALTVQLEDATFMNIIWFSTGKVSPSI